MRLDLVNRIHRMYLFWLIEPYFSIREAVGVAYTYLG